MLSLKKLLRKGSAHPTFAGGLGYIDSVTDLKLDWILKVALNSTMPLIFPRWMPSTAIKS